MARFIIVTFAFLGWAFYEMSGGAEFEPSKARLTDIRTDPLKPVVSTSGNDSVSAELETEVTRVSLNLTSVDDVLTDGGPRPARLPQQQDEATQAVAIAQPEQGESVAIIPSLVAGADASKVVEVSATAQPVSSFDDIRSVSANAVNVRGGPGTGFGVVGRMVRGDEIEVLEDNGDGWVRFRSVDGGTEGWVADFLLSGG